MKFRIGLLILVISIIALSFCIKKCSQPMPSPLHMTQQELSFNLVETAWVKAKQRQKVYAELAAQIDKINIAEGDSVQTGSLLFQYKTQEIQRLVNEHSHQLKRLKFQYAALERDLKQQAYLLSQQLITQQEYQLSEDKLALSAIDVASQQETLHYYQDKKHLYQKESEFQGLVSRIYVEEGQYVQVGTAMLEILDPHSLQVELFIREYDSHKVRIGQAVKIYSPKSDGATVKASVSKIIPTFSKKDSGVKVVLSFDKDEEYSHLQAGNRVTAEIQLKPSKISWVLPVNSIQNEQGFSYVRLFENKQKRQVVLGDSDGIWVEVLQGLEPGERILNELSD